MPPRGLLLILIAGLILAIGAVGAARRETSDDSARAPVSAPAAPLPAADPGGVEANVVTATLPSDRVVRAKLGEEVELHVTSPAPDLVSIVALAVRAPVGPGITGPIRFTALTPGRFDVRLELAGSSVGQVVVAGNAGSR